MAEHVGFSRLPVGTKILWESVGSSRTFSLGFFFATGSRFDPPRLGGTAHLVEHLLFKGTRSHSAASLARMVDRVGGDLNAWTDREELAFTCTVPAESWRVAVDALSELCLHPTFPPEEFEREKEVIRNEILAALEDPEDVSYDAFLQTLSPGEWSRPVAGTEESLARITLADARAWWKEHGTPEKLTVSFSGGVEPRAVEEALASVLAGPVVPPAEASEPPRFSPRQRQWVQKADFQMTQVLGGFVLPSPQSPREAAVWQMFSLLWGEAMSSRLFQAVRERKGLCYSITSQLFDAEGPWGLQFFATCAPENTAALLDELEQEVRRLGTEPPSVEEWEDARQALRGGIVVGSERSENRSGRLWRQYESFGSLQNIDEIVTSLAEPVSAEEARTVVQTLVSQVPSLLVWGRVPRIKLKGSWGG